MLVVHIKVRSLDTGMIKAHTIPCNIVFQLIRSTMTIDYYTSSLTNEHQNTVSWGSIILHDESCNSMGGLLNI